MWPLTTMEFEVAHDATDACVGTGGAYTTTTTSTSWQTKDVSLARDAVTRGSALDVSYAEHVLSGKALRINYGTCVTQFPTLTSGDCAVSFATASSRIESASTTFDQGQ